MCQIEVNGAFRCPQVPLQHAQDNMSRTAIRLGYIDINSALVACIGAHYIFIAGIFLLLFCSTFGLKTYLQIWLPSSTHAPKSLNHWKVPDFLGQSLDADPNFYRCLHLCYPFINLRTGLKLI